jgi:DNA helicase-2/ATP-dependent DNA helicase PcrA
MDGDALIPPIVVEELELLGRVLRAVEEASHDEEPSEEGLVRDLERLREILVSGQEQKDRLALLDQWNRSEALLQQLRRSRRRAQVEPDSPYFAHLRLREDAGDRDLCLGKATCVRDGVRVVDWRHAPVSRIFYRYRQGESYEEEFGGRPVAGEVVARRTVVIRDGELERVDAPEGSFRRLPGGGGWQAAEGGARRLRGGEGVALRAHGASSAPARRLGTDPRGRRHRLDKRLPEIAGLLDPSQFDLITHREPGVLVVRGSAGSGKTTVALHRIAYLAYEDARVDSPDTLFLTFSPALREYVAHVLPALGLERVAQLTFGEWAAALRTRLFPRLPRESRDDTPAVVRRAKLHAALVHALEEQVARVPGKRSWQQALDDWVSVLTDGALLRRCLDREEGAGLGEAALEEVVDWGRRRADELFAWLEGDRGVAAQLDAEDDALLLRAWQLRVGPLGGRRPLRYRHVTVDEVQDFSPVELRVVLDCLEEDASVTLAGDAQQQIVDGVGFASWDRLLRSLELSEAQTASLTVSYRSTREIMEFARRVLGPLCQEEEIESPRSGPPVELFEFTDPGACVAFLADALQQLASDEPLASVAVLTPSREASVLYQQGLERCEVPHLRRVERWDFSFSPGVEVAEIEQAKGLEFDYVVLVDVGVASFPDRPEARRLLHVGATRAVHQLWVMSAGAPSPLVGERAGERPGPPAA